METRELEVERGGPEGGGGNGEDERGRKEEGGREGGREGGKEGEREGRRVVERRGRNEKWASFGQGEERARLAGRSKRWTEGGGCWRERGELSTGGWMEGWIRRARRQRMQKKKVEAGEWRRTPLRRG